MARYEIIIYWSDDDQAFIAEVPELPGCMADGKTYQEAIANAEASCRSGSKPRKNLAGPSLSQRVDCTLLEVEIAKAAWLEAARRSGKPTSPPKYRPVIYEAG